MILSQIHQPVGLDDNKICTRGDNRLHVSSVVVKDVKSIQSKANENQTKPHIVDTENQPTTYLSTHHCRLLLACRLNKISEHVPHPFQPCYTSSLREGK